MPQRGRERRTRIVRARITPAQHDRWDAAREARGHRDISALIRAAVETVLTGRPDPADRPQPQTPTANVDAIRVLRGIGNNLNQVARWCHQERRAPDAATLARLVAEIRTAVVSLHTATATPAGHVDQAPEPESQTGDHNS